MDIEGSISTIKAELDNAIAANVMLKQDIDHLKLAVKELTRGQRSLVDAITSQTMGSVFVLNSRS